MVFSAIVTSLLSQIDELIQKYEELKKASKYDDLSDIPREAASEFIIAGMAAIHRIAGKNSQFAIQAEALLQQYKWYQISAAITHIGGAIKALRQAVAAGYLVSVQELLHANIFGDFLEMSEHLLHEGFKDPAAVLIGSVLEEHLRKLCDKHNISVEFTDAKGLIRPKKADLLNSDLTNQNIYSKLDQKNISAWLGLRNNAAHGHYSGYTAQQVELFLMSVRDFIARNPA